jgi:hypothetical protein
MVVLSLLSLLLLSTEGAGMVVVPTPQAAPSCVLKAENGDVTGSFAVPSAVSS